MSNKSSSCMHNLGIRCNFIFLINTVTIQCRGCLEISSTVLETNLMIRLVSTETNAECGMERKTKLRTRHSHGRIFNEDDSDDQSSSSTVCVMEVKLSQRKRAENLPSLPNLTNPSPNQSLHLQSWPNTARLFEKQLRGLALIWRFQVQETSKGQPSTNHDVVPAVKGGETQSSISKLYGVPSTAIAAVKENTVDIDLVFRRQRLNIPSAGGESRATRDNFLLQDRIHGSLDRKSFVSPRLPHVKNTGYLLVLVPFIALCIRCIVVALQTRLSEPSKLDRIDQPEGQDRRFRGSRWKSALSDLRDPDGLDTKSMGGLEDEVQNSLKETMHSYEKLERDYQNFLSECGLSDQFPRPA